MHAVGILNRNTVNWFDIRMFVPGLLPTVLLCAGRLDRKWCF